MDTSPAPVPAPQRNMVLAVLAYLGILVIVSYIIGKDDPFVRYHIKQGLVLFGIEIVVWLIFSMVWMLWMLSQLIWLGLLILSVIGIVNAVQGKEAEVPLVGQFAKNIPL